MFQFSEKEHIENIEKEISNVIAMLEQQNLTIKEAQKLELRFNNLNNDLRKLNKAREWFDEKNLSALRSYEKTTRQIKSEKNIRKFLVEKTSNSKTVKIEGVALVQKHISEGNVEEANRCLGKLIFDQEIKPSLDIIAVGIEKDLINFVAEDIWQFLTKGKKKQMDNLYLGFSDPNSDYPPTHATAKEPCPICSKPLGYNITLCAVKSDPSLTLQHLECYRMPTFD